jgi:very-short-patch-repair endonuclease
MLQLQLDTVDAYSLAMEQSKISLLRSLVLENSGAEPLEELSLEITLLPDLGDPLLVPLPTLHGGESFHASDQPVPLPVGLLAQEMEDRTIELRCRVLQRGEPLQQASRSLRLLSYNTLRWPRSIPGDPAEAYACFVTPNHPVIAQVLKETSRTLEALGSANSLEGYQSGPERVVEMTGALYLTLGRLGISYINPPAGYWSAGQRIRLPDQVLGEGLGTCADLAPLAAACLEQIGLFPVLVCLEAHALPGVFLSAEAAMQQGALLEDVSTVQQLIDAKELLLFDSTSYVAKPQPSFTEAVVAALNHLQSFEVLVNVYQARRNGFEPLPIRMRVISDEPGEVLSLARQILLQASQQAAADSVSTSGPAEPEAPAEPIDTTVRRRFQTWQDRLLDLSTRNNRLLNIGNLATGASKAAGLILDVPEPLLPDLVRLFESGKPLTLLGDQVAGEGDEGLARSALELSRNTCRTRRALDRDDPMSADQLMKTGKLLFRKSRLEEEETGFSPLYLAAGLLQWQDSAHQARLAPLLLFPVEIRVDNRNQNITLMRTQGEPLGNVTLFERLRQDFDLSLDILTDLPENDDGLDFAAILSEVSHAIIGRSGWRVIPSVFIHTFNFATFLLWRDLQDNQVQILQSDAVRHIATAGHDPFIDPVPDLELEDLDDLSASDLPLVVEADSTQILAIHAAMKGRSFVLQGPPGTGKSQTITNIIAAAMASGKTVLFVAQKAAAVEVVLNRLKAIGLEAFCLDLHKPDSNPEQVHQSFQQALQAQEAMPECWDEDCGELDQLRRRLRDHTRALHQIRPIGCSLFEMLDAVQPARPLPPLPAELDTDQLTAERFHANQAKIRAYAAEHALHAVTESNPWRFLPDPEWSFDLEQQLRTLLPRLGSDVLQLGGRLDHFRAAGLPLATSSWEGMSRLADVLGHVGGCSVPPVVLDQERWPHVEQAARNWQKEEEQMRQGETDLRNRWQPAAFEHNLEPLIDRLQKLLGSFALLRWIGAFFFRRRLRGLVREPGLGLRRLLEDLRGIRDLPLQQERLEQERQTLQRQLPSWGGEAQELPQLLNEWVSLAAMAKASPEMLALLRYASVLEPPDQSELLGLHARVEEGFSELASLLNHPSLPLAGQRGVPIAQLGSWLGELHADLPGLRSLSLAHELETEFRRSGPAAALDWAAASSLPLAELEEAYRTAVLRHWFQRLFDSDPALRRFSGSRHSSLVEQFRALDEQVQQLSRRYVRARVISRMPNRNLSLNGSEQAELNREIVKKKRHLPLRQLFGRIPTLLPKLKPCLLASPLSVSRFLPADGQRFDIIIFDEASQVETHHAIAAIGRGEQVVIVGDNKQMPPSSFFQRPAIADDGINTSDGVDDLESILDEAIACGMPQQMLQWHYRSRHEALIDFSNRCYYSSRLNLFPAPCRSDSQLGLHWHPVIDGDYQSGERTNKTEARALVELLLERLRAHTPGERSFGVITFSIPQQLLIDSLLQKACEAEPELEGWFSRDNLEYCFVKNLETVQGDERDEIFFSICFGPRQDGVLSMFFGALNKPGGERRLNVAITRARCSLHVFASFQPEQIDRSRTNARAVHHLQDFLAFCRSQERLADRPLRVNDFDGRLQRQIHELLVREGYQVECKVGCANYRIDLAVIDPENPSRYRIGIECDGAAYAAAKTVRDRDRLRTAVLEQLGWTMHRVWSLEWQLNPANEQQRLLQAVRHAFEAPAPSAAFRPARAEDAGERKAKPAPPPPPPAPVPAPAPTQLGRPYAKAILEPADNEFRTFYSPQSTPQIANRLIALLAVEAPVLQREATVRVTQCWNGKAFSQKAHERLMMIASSLHRQERLYLDGEETLWVSRAQFEGWRGFRLPPDSGRAIDSVPMAERRGALLLIAREALSIDPEALLREACLMLTGGSRFTQQQRQAITGALEQLLESRLLAERDGRLYAQEQP